MLTFFKKHTETIAWLLIGTGITIVSIFCGLVYANNLGWGQGVFDIDRTGQAGSFVGGTAGALWALAGVFLFKASLDSQQKQHKEQQHITNRNHFEATLYKLIENNKSISFVCSEDKNNLTNTLGRLKDRYFPDTTYDDYEVFEHWAERNIGFSEKHWIRSIHLILDYIIRYGSDFEFYAQVFMAHLSEDEQKFLFICLVAQNDLQEKLRTIGAKFSDDALWDKREPNFYEEFFVSRKSDLR